MKSNLKNHRFFSKSIKSIDKVRSSTVINDIINDRDINYNELELEYLMDKIENLRNLYNSYKNKVKLKDKNYPRNYIFWYILSKHYDLVKFELSLKKKANISHKSKSKYNINSKSFTKLFGFNPSLLTLCINALDIKDYIEKKDYFWNAKKILTNFHSFEGKESNSFFYSLKSGNVNLVSPICPDYEYRKLGKNIYSFTFNALNTNIGLPASRLIKQIKIFYDFLEKNNVNYKHYVYYGDFESFSKINCKRLKLNQNSFLERLHESAFKLKKEKIFSYTGLFVEDLSSYDEWKKLMKTNKAIIKNYYKNNQNFKKKFDEILIARKTLYANWFPKQKSEFYFDLLIEQGCEYASMTDIILSKFENPIIIAADHPKMKLFYNLNKKIALAYLQRFY